MSTPSVNIQRLETDIRPFENFRLIGASSVPLAIAFLGLVIGTIASTMLYVSLRDGRGAALVITASVLLTFAGLAFFVGFVRSVKADRTADAIWELNHRSIHTQVETLQSLLRQHDIEVKSAFVEAYATQLADINNPDWSSARSLESAGRKVVVSVPDRTSGFVVEIFPPA